MRHKAKGYATSAFAARDADTQASRGLQSARTRVVGCAAQRGATIAAARVKGACRSSRRFTSSCFFSILALFVINLFSAPNSVASDNGDYIVIKASRVITVSGREYAPGTVVIEDGKISLVGGSKIESPPMARVIDATGETLMPGFIHPRSRFGLDRYKRSGIHGDQKAADEVYPEAIRFDDLLRAGYTTVGFTPSGEDIPGLAAAYRTAGPDESRRLTDSAYLHVVPNWRAKGKKMLRDAFKKAQEEIEKVEKARKEWEEKQKAKKAEEEKKKEDEGKKPEKEEGKHQTVRIGSEPQVSEDDGDDGKDDKKPAKEKPKKKEPEKEEFKPPPIDPKYQPLVDLIQHKKGARMMVQLRRASDWHHLNDVLEPYEKITPSLYLATGRQTDYHHVVDLLGQRKARVLVRPWIHYLPYTTFRYNLLARLAAAGCEVSVIPFGENRAEFRRVRERLSDVVRAGLPREEALKMITLHPARALGLGDRMGSLEKDRDADIVFLDGDPLDPQARVTRVMVMGKIVWEKGKSR